MHAGAAVACLIEHHGKKCFITGCGFQLNLCSSVSGKFLNYNNYWKSADNFTVETPSKGCIETMQ